MSHKFTSWSQFLKKNNNNNLRDPYEDVKVVKRKTANTSIGYQYRVIVKNMLFGLNKHFKQVIFTLWELVLDIFHFVFAPFKRPNK